MTRGACAIPTRVPALRNLRWLLIAHVWAERFHTLELTEGFILMAIAVGNTTETGHKVSQKYNYCIFITYLSEPMGNESNTLFFLLDFIPHF